MIGYRKRGIPLERYQCNRQPQSIEKDNLKWELYISKDTTRYILVNYSWQIRLKSKSWFTCGLIITFMPDVAPHFSELSVTSTFTGQMSFLCAIFPYTLHIKSLISKTASWDHFGESSPGKILSVIEKMST